MTVAARAQVDVAGLAALDPMCLRDRLVGNRIEGDAAIGGVVNAVALARVLKLDGARRHGTVYHRVREPIDLRATWRDVTAEIWMQRFRRSDEVDVAS